MASGTPTDTETPIRVIVMMAGTPALTSAGAGSAAAESTIMAEVDANRADLRAAHDDMLAAADDAGLEVTPVREFTDLIDGVAVTVSEADVERLADLPGVADVVPDQRIRSATDDSVPLIGAPEVWERDDADGAPVRGAGMTVAVLDSGIDYTNPSLGGAFGPGHKVVAGYDFVDGDTDPMDEHNGHGTHVAGIIAGDGEVVGVAPEAELTAYRVMNSYGSGWTADIIAGLEAAIDPANPHRADVVNLSLGGPGDGTDPLGQAATAATEAGVVVVASAGNSGPGAHTVGSPALADGVLSVGASASGIRLPVADLVEPRQEPLQTFRVPYSASPPDEPVIGELVDVGDGTEEDYDRIGDVTGKIVAYRARLPRGMENVQPHMLEQARLAEDRGALALIAYTGAGSGPTLSGETGELVSADEAGTVEVPLRGIESGESFRMDRLVVLGFAETQWERVVRDLAEGPVRIAIAGEDITDQVASFSSRGPTDDFSIEPDLVAPGVEIASTWPLAQWEPGVYRLSGTSMAAPHVAGAAALVRQLHPDASVAEISGRLVGSAKGLEAGPTTAGAGRLDVPAAASTSLMATPTAASMGLADMAGDTVEGSSTVTLHNLGADDLDVTLTTEAAPGSVGTATVTPREAVIPAGGELEVQVAVSAETPEYDADLSGWVVATAGADVPQVRIPYLLAARHLVVQASPDPSDGASEGFVWTPVAVSEPPVVTVTPPRGAPYDVPAHHDHGNWYRAELHGEHVGAYAVRASVTTDDGRYLHGSGSFEVAAPVGNSPSPVSWQPIGPNADGGPIATTAADPDVAAITQYTKAGPWTTDDGGRTWRQHNRLPVAGGTGDIVVDAADPQTMWYAVNGSTGGVFDVLLDPTYQGRILRTDDGGETWRILDFPDVSVLQLVSDARTQTLVAVTEDAVMVSRDGGEQWSGHPNPVGDELRDADVGGTDVFLAGPAGVWALRGVVAGEPSTTEQVYDSEAAGVGTVDGMVADDVVVAVLTGDDTVVGSYDGGATWSQLYDVPDGGALDIHMDGGDIIVSTYREYNHLGADHGTSWTTLAQPVPGAIEDDFARWGDDLLWSSPGAGMFRTDRDGAGSQRTGVQGRTAYDLAVVQDAEGEARLLAGTDADVYDTALPTRPKLPADVAEWGLSGFEAHTGTRVATVVPSPHDPQTVWKIRADALSQFWVYRSVDGGQEWEVRGRTHEVAYDLALTPADPARVVVPFGSRDGYGLFVTTDAGDTWRKLFHDEVFTTVVADPDDPDRLWLGSSSGLYRSDDFGHTVQKVTDGQVTALAMSGDRIVAAGPVIQVSEDGGQSFTTADAGGVPMMVSDVVVSPRDPDVWYAAAGSYSANGLIKGGRGVLRSSDGGHTWVNVSGGLQNLDVVSLAASPDGRWLFAGTDQGGVHRARIR